MLRPTFRESGTTSSEKFLSTLCEKCFFGLWSYPNLYTNEGNKGGATTGKELCDILVVFGNDIIIFSDKKIKYKVTENVTVGWSRWYKKALKQSAAQLYGAERWIKEFPDRIFYDKECKDKFALALSDKATIHRVAITSGMAKTCSEYYGKGSSGTFIISPPVEGDKHYALPFVIGTIDPQKGFVHVFNELSISMVLNELDTVADFIDYLRKREAFLTSGKVNTIAGEEELLGFFLANHFEFEDKIPDLVANMKGLEDYGVALMEGDWSQYLYSKDYLYVKQTRKQSYAWDSLIKGFDEAILAGTVPEWTGEHICSHEIALRMLARERRAYRQVLARNFLEKITAVKPEERSARVLHSVLYPDSCYVLLCFGREHTENYEKYREERRGYLTGYCYVVKFMNPSLRYVIGIAREQLAASGHSEDLVIFDFEEWSPADEEFAKQAREEYGILKNVRRNDKHVANNLLREMFPWLVTEAKTQKKKIGRNDPCICGSGKKYKKCCLGQAAYPDEGVMRL